MFHVEHFVLGFVYVQLYVYIGHQVKQGKRVTKRRKAVSLRPSASEGNRARYLPAELAGLYKPVKKPVTLRLDADVLAWFKKQGRGYQTRINRALRKLMMEERKRSGE
jgi:uncharacterized protein (DUF4415 family)